MNLTNTTYPRRQAEGPCHRPISINNKAAPLAMSGKTFWMLALPLKHREQKGEGLTNVVEEDRNILFSFLKDKLSVASDLAQVHQFAFPQFKVLSRPHAAPCGIDAHRHALIWPTCPSLVGRHAGWPC